MPDFIDDECEEVVQCHEKEFYDPKDLQSGGSSWYTNLMSRLESQNLSSKVEGYDSDDSFLCEEIEYEKPKKKLRKLKDAKPAKIEKKPAPKKKSRVIVDSDDDEIVKKRKVVFEDE